MEEVTFKPAILKKSEKIVARKNEENLFVPGQRPVESARHLYLDSFNRQVRISQLRRQRDENFSFKPKLVAKPRKPNLSLNRSVTPLNNHNTISIFGKDIEYNIGRTKSPKPNVFRRL